MNIILYGAKVIGDDEVVYVSSVLSDVANYVKGTALVIIRFVADTGNYTVV